MLPGSKINPILSKNLHVAEIVSSYRNNPKYVDEDGSVLKTCSFTSASTAAQFVAGQSNNGLLVWKINPRENLKYWLSQHPEEAINHHKKKEAKQMNSYFFQLFLTYFGLKQNEKYCFVYQVQSTPIYSYSQQTVDFIVNEIEKDPEYIFDRIKEQIKQKC